MSRDFSDIAEARSRLIGATGVNETAEANGELSAHSAGFWR